MNLKYLMLSIFCCGFSLVRSDAQAAIVTGQVNSMQIIAQDYQTLLSDQFDFKTSVSKSFPSPSSMFKYGGTVNHLPGMFCKLEYKIETKSKLAPRFRLGSLQYTEWMEGKNSFYMRY
jgi:hypothetical protein